MSSPKKYCVKGEPWRDQKNVHECAPFYMTRDFPPKKHMNNMKKHQVMQRHVHLLIFRRACVYSGNKSPNVLETRDPTVFLEIFLAIYFCCSLGWEACKFLFQKPIPFQMRNRPRHSSHFASHMVVVFEQKYFYRAKRPMDLRVSSERWAFTSLRCTCAQCRKGESSASVVCHWRTGQNEKESESGSSLMINENWQDSGCIYSSSILKQIQKV